MSKCPSCGKEYPEIPAAAGPIHCPKPCGTIFDIKEEKRKYEWAVAITTAPRHEPTLEKCINSIRACGWEPVVFAEPGSLETDCFTIWNEKQLGVWRNWQNSVNTILDETDADTVLTVQDDSFFHPGSKTFIENNLWPAADTGFVSLYTAGHYTYKKYKMRPPGVNRLITTSFWGSCALVFPRTVLEEMRQTPEWSDWWGVASRAPKNLTVPLKQHRLENPHTIANSDTAIGKIILRLKRSMWVVDPSPVTHIAMYSSCGHGDNVSDFRRNAIRPADHNRPLEAQIPYRKTYEIQ